MHLFLCFEVINSGQDIYERIGVLCAKSVEKVKSRRMKAKSQPNFTFILIILRKWQRVLIEKSSRS